MERLIIGIDPGINNTGLCAMLDGVVLSVALIRRSYDALAANAKDQCYWLNDFRFNVHKSLDARSQTVIPPRPVFVVEMPRIYPTSNGNDIVDLAFMAGALLARGMEYGEGFVVYPHQWKGNVPKDIHNNRMLAAMPELETSLAQFLKSKREHIIDAAGIALWQEKSWQKKQ